MGLAEFLLWLGGGGAIIFTTATQIYQIWQQRQKDKAQEKGQEKQSPHQIESLVLGNVDQAVRIQQQIIDELREAYENAAKLIEEKERALAECQKRTAELYTIIGRAEFNRQPRNQRDDT